MSSHGHQLDGTPVIDEREQAWDDGGYTPAQLRLARRAVGRPAMGSADASAESVRLDPEPKRDLLARAEIEHTSVSDVIHRAVLHYLRVG